MKWIRPFCLCLLLPATGSAQTHKLHVLASFLPLYAHCKQVAGDAAEVDILLGRDTSPHDYEFKPGDLQKLTWADVFVMNGVGLEDWLGDLISRSGSKSLAVVDSSRGVELLDNPRVMALQAGKSGDAEGGHNPHIWLDPVNALQQVRNIRDALATADPAHAETYRRNAERYLGELQKLDADYRDTLGSLSGCNLVTFHDAFPYLARRYHLHDLGCIEEFPEKEPRPQDLRRLIGLIQKNHVKVLFAENGYAPKLLEEIARQSGAGVVEIDTLEVGNPEADAYLVRMRRNLAVLQKVWQ